MLPKIHISHLLCNPRDKLPKSPPIRLLPLAPSTPGTSLHTRTTILRAPRAAGLLHCEADQYKAVKEGTARREEEGGREPSYQKLTSV